MPKVGRRTDSQMYEIGSSNDRVLRNAPFGTSYTPVVRTKIVGGKPRYVLDREIVTEDPRHSVQLERNVAHNQTTQNQSTLADFSGRSRTPDANGSRRKQLLASEATSGSSHTAPPAPSKSDVGGGAQRLNWNSRPVLPPIGNEQRYYEKDPQPRVRNEHVDDGALDTRLAAGARPHGETPRGLQKPESLTVLRNYGVSGATSSHNDFNKVNSVAASRGGPGAERGVGTNGKPYESTANERQVNANRDFSLMAKDQELQLLRRLGEQLGAADDTRLLKDVYVELTGYDRNLSGWVDYGDIAFTLTRMKIFVREEDLREAAAQFISHEHPGKVNYEKLLSYLASAMRQFASFRTPGPTLRSVDPPPSKKRAEWPNDSRQEEQPFFSQLQQQTRIQETLNAQAAERPPFIHNRQSEKTQHTGSQSKLMHVVEEQLMSLEDGVDLEKLRQEFIMADRLQRQTLSHKQIKDIVYRLRIPLQESVINQILDRCQTHGDGQYWWQDFIDFLERVQPVHTGLEIKPSKRPTEYAIHYPVPDSSWPHIAHAVGNKASGSESDGGARYTAPDSVRTDAGLDLTTVSKFNPLPRLDKLYQQKESQGHASLTTSSPTQRLSRHHHNDTTIDDDWFDRFAVLAEALYRSDNKGEGLLSADEAKWLIMKYNDVYQLGLKDTDVRQSVLRYSHGPSVAIEPLLKELATTTVK